jgi:hypothetical protein
MKKISFFILWIVLLTGVCTEIIAQTRTDSVQDLARSPRHESWSGTKRHNWLLSYQTEAGYGNGLSTGYLYCPDHRRKYFVGPQLGALVKEQNRSFDMSGSGYNTQNSTLKTTAHVVSLDLIQRYIIVTEDKASVFISLDLGWRSVSQDLESSYDYDSGFPFGWVHGGDFVTRNAKSVVTVDVGLGCRVTLWKQQALNLRIGMKATGKYDVVNEPSVRYSTQGLQFSTIPGSPTILTFSLGAMF